MNAAVLATVLVGFVTFSALAEQTERKAAVPAAPDAVLPVEGEVIVKIRADGTVQVAGKTVAREGLKEELPKLLEGRKDQRVRIQADADVAYAGVVEVIDACKKAGLQDVSLATASSTAQETGGGEWEDKLVVLADVVPDLDSKFFGTVETSRQPWILEDSDGSLEDTMDGTIDAGDLVLIERTANCVSTHQGEHKMDFCDAVKTGDGVEIEISGGAPAYMSSLTVPIDAKRQFVCKFEAVYPSSTAPLRWAVTKKAMKLKTAVGDAGSRLRGWISVEFDEIDGTNGVAKRYKIEGYFKPVIQSAPAEIEEDK